MFLQGLFTGFIGIECQQGTYTEMGMRLQEEYEYLYTKIVQNLRLNYRIMVITFLCSRIITYIPHILRRIETWIQRTGDLNVILKTIEMY